MGRCESGEGRRPAPYICPIYRRDFLGFLDHAKLQECRLISRSYNYTILECPKLLPVRQKFQGFHVNATVSL